MKGTRSKLIAAAAGAALLAALLLAAGEGRVCRAAAGNPTAAEILKKCDAFHYPKKMVWKIDATLEDKNGTKSYMKLELYQKGIKRLLRFTEPADINGFSVLTKDASTIYVYEPSLKKVRRIAAHAKKQSMLGADFTIDEASTISLAGDYDAKIVSESDTEYQLFLSQKAGKDKAWPIMKLTIDKNKFYAKKLDYCDDKEVVRKTEVRSNLKTFDGRLVTATMKMTDHQKKHSTQYDATDVQFTMELPDELFTKRSLVREE